MMNVSNMQSAIVGNSGIRSTGLYRFLASINENGIVCLSCQNSPDFSLFLKEIHFGQRINHVLLQRLNSTIIGQCGTEGGGQFVMKLVSPNRYRIDCDDDMSFWIEFSI